MAKSGVLQAAGVEDEPTTFPPTGCTSPGTSPTSRC
jgi:hypothetical protein